MGMGDKDKMNHAVPPKLQALIIKAAKEGIPIPSGKGGQARVDQPSVATRARPRRCMAGKNPTTG